MKWDAEADQHLLLAILCAHKVCVDYTRVAGIIGCTPRACEERLKKLRKHAKECGYDFGPPQKKKIKGMLGEDKVSKGGKVGKGDKSKFDRLGFAKDSKSGKCKVVDEGRVDSGVSGVRSDDGEVKKEPKQEPEVMEMEIKMETDIENFPRGGITDDEAGPLMKRRKVGMATFFNDNAMPFASTADGVRIPLGIPLEIANGPISYGNFSQLPPLKPRTFSCPSNTASILPSQNPNYRPAEIAAPTPISAGLRSAILPPPLVSVGMGPLSPIVIDSPPPTKEGQGGDTDGNRAA